MILASLTGLGITLLIAGGLLLIAALIFVVLPFSSPTDDFTEDEPEPIHDFIAERRAAEDRTMAHVRRVQDERAANLGRRAA